MIHLLNQIELFNCYFSKTSRPAGLRPINYLTSGSKIKIVGLMLGLCANLKPVNYALGRNAGRNVDVIHTDHQCEQIEMWNPCIACKDYYVQLSKETKTRTSARSRTVYAQCSPIDRSICIGRICSRESRKRGLIPKADVHDAGIF